MDTKIKNLGRCLGDNYDISNSNITTRTVATTARTYKVERESLEAHVDICAERYDRLEVRMDNLNEKVEKNSDLISRESNATRKMVMTSAGVVIASLVSAIVGLLYLLS